MPPLESDARQTLEREGWLVVRSLLDATHVQKLIDATERLERQAAAFTSNQLVHGATFELQTVTGRRGEPPVFPGALRKIRFPSKREKVFADLRRDATLLSTLDALGLPTPKCLVDQLNFKLPRVGTGFPFHQDTAFVLGASKGRIDRHGGMNLIIALDPADADNGGFEVLGRTHHQEVAFTYDRATTNEGVFDESHRALIPLQPGDALFFHPQLAHGSGHNRSDRLRRLVTLWFRGGGSPLHAGGRDVPIMSPDR